MGKRYYCDYCERSFADGAENRKKHLASIHHQKLRKAHYDMFKDPATILEEDRRKKPCRKFLFMGACEYGTNCKYSHLTPADVEKLEEQVRMRMAGTSAVKAAEAKVDSWIESKLSKLKESNSSVFSVSQPTLPPALSSVPNLPPSLIPSTVFEFYNAQKRSDQEWG